MTEATTAGAQGADITPGEAPVRAVRVKRAPSARARAVWTDSQLASLQALYPHYKTDDVAFLIGHTVAEIYRKANSLGIVKTDAYLASPASGRLRGDEGVQSRFKPGNPSWNTGKKIGSKGRSAQTQFKPGQLPPNHKPIGSERRADGYLQRKMTDTGYPPRDWVPVHVLLWEEKRGPVPENHCVLFKDRNKDNIVIENLECLSRSDLMKRNSLHSLPKELTQLVQLRGVLTRHINKRSKNV